MGSESQYLVVLPPYMPVPARFCKWMETTRLTTYHKKKIGSKHFLFLIYHQISGKYAGSWLG